MGYGMKSVAENHAGADRIGDRRLDAGVLGRQVWLLTWRRSGRL